MEFLISAQAEIATIDGLVTCMAWRVLPLKFRCGLRLVFMVSLIENEKMISGIPRR